MASLTELADVFESMARLHRKASRILKEIDLDPQKLSKNQKQEAGAPDDVMEVWERLLDAWAMHRMDKTGSKPARHLGPSLTIGRIRMVKEALKRHGLEKTKRAAIGLYLSDFHCGKNDTGKEYLEPERPFVIKDGKDMTEYFANIYMETHREF